MKMKNVLLISQSLTGGGAERVIANCSIALHEKTNLYVVTYEQNKDEFEHLGFRININLPGGEGNVIKKLITAFKRIYVIKKIKKRYDIDYSISFLPQTDYVNVFSRRRKEKVIIEVSSNTGAAFFSKASMFFRKLILKSADYVVAVSEGSRCELIEKYGISLQRSTTIYNSCDIERIKAGISAFDGLENKKIAEKLPPKYILSVGSFRKPKGHWHLIKAFASVSKLIPEYKLVILGDGVYRSKYEELVRNLEIDENCVVMPGFVSNPYPIISKSSLFVFSSIYEGFGNVIIEAMACGVPVLSTDCDFGPREIIAPSTSVKEKAKGIEYREFGCLLEPFSAQEDIDVSTNISDKEKMMGKAIVEMVLGEGSRKNYTDAGLIRCQDFSNENYGEKWINLFEEIENEERR